MVSMKRIFAIVFSVLFFLSCGGGGGSDDSGGGGGGGTNDEFIQRIKHGYNLSINKIIIDSSK